MSVNVILFGQCLFPAIFPALYTFATFYVPKNTDLRHTIVFLFRSVRQHLPTGLCEAQREPYRTIPAGSVIEVEKCNSPRDH